MHLRREERFDRLQHALESLPPDYREVIRLSRIEGMKTSEIAELMGRSSAAVKQLLFRALRRLRESFGDQSLRYAMVVTATVGFAAMLMFYLGARHLTADLRKILDAKS